MLQGRGVKLSRELVQGGGAAESARELKHKSRCEHTHGCALERMLRGTSPRTYGASGWGWRELLSAGTTRVPWNCLPCLETAASWREFIYYALISIHLKSRLFSACSDKNLSPVRFMVSSCTMVSVATTERWWKHHLCLFRLSRKVENWGWLHHSGWMTCYASLA